MQDTAKEAALAAASDLFGEQSVEGEAEASEQPEASAVEGEEPQHEAEPVVNELPDDLKALLEEPDFEAEAEAELAAQPEEEDDEDEDEYEDDEEKVALKKRALAAEKKAAWLEQQKVERERSSWVKEAQKYFPHADAEKITAASRRAFIRAAKAEHDAVESKIATSLKAEREALAAEKQTLEEKIRAEVKAELEAAWGKPLAGPGAAPVQAAAASEAVDAAFRQRGFAAGVKEMMFGGGE